MENKKNENSRFRFRYVLKNILDRINKKDEYARFRFRYGLKNILARVKKKDGKYLYWIVVILKFSKDLRCTINIIWEPIIQSIVTFIIFFIFYYNKILFLDYVDGEIYFKYRLYIFIGLILLIILIFLYYGKSVKKEINSEEGRKKWKILIKKVIISLINMIINIYIVLKIFDISLMELMQYMIVMQVYKAYGIMVHIINIVEKRKVIGYYNINSFIYYPYIYNIIIVSLIYWGFNYTILNMNLANIIINYYLNYRNVMLIKFTEGFLYRMGEEKIIKW